MQPDQKKMGEIHSKELLLKLQNHLKTKTFRFNPDEAAVQGLIRAMVKRKETSGEYYCPCRRVTGNIEEDKKIICPCIYHEAEVERDGHCHCWLFTKKENAN